MASSRLISLAVLATLLSSSVLGQGSGSPAATGNRIDVVERNLSHASRASLPGLARELRDLELESGKQPGQQARRNDVRINRLRRELTGLKARPGEVRSGVMQRYPQRTRIITPGIPVVEIDEEWRALQGASAGSGH